MRFLFLLFCVPLFMGCDKDFECSYDPCANVAPTGDIQRVQDYLAANSLTATQHCSGIFYKIEEPGTGDYPDGCSVVNVTYVGKLTDGSTFDSGPLRIGLQDVIRGWTNGVPLIREGGRIRLYIPPTLGYGTRAVGPIPPNSILIFEISLIDVEQR